jgi:hypothetical protein
LKKWLFIPAAAVVTILSLTDVVMAAPQDAPAAPGRGRGRGAPRRGPGGPVPLLSDGKPDFSGIWNGQQTVAPTGSIAATGPGSAAADGMPPMLPWAVKLQAARATSLFADDFEARCLPGGPPRIPPYHISLFSTPKLVLMLFEGNTHMYRQFFVDGSDHPKDLKPTFYGDSRAHWEGDTLVVDTIGFNDISWIDGQGHPHTKGMHLVEKFRRPDFGNLTIDVVLDDPGTFTRPWHMSRVTTIEQGMEMTEYVCNENNQDPGHLDKAHDGVAPPENANPKKAHPNGVPKLAAKKAPQPPAGSTPRTPEGNVDLSGVWVLSGSPVLPAEPSYQPWAKKLYDERKAAKGKGDPESFCLPDGAVRVTPQPYKIVQGPKMIALLAEANTHSYRRFFLDERSPKAALEVEPETHTGISVGKWDGDALVVDTVGFNDKTWLDPTGKPHSEAMHLTERYTRPDLGHLNVHITIEDEKALTKPFSFDRVFTLAPGWELQEYVCQAILDGVE